MLLHLPRLLGLDTSVPESTPEDEAAYRAKQQETSYRTWMVVFIGILLMGLLWWPTDLIIFQGRPREIRAFAIARGISVALTLVALVTIARVRLLRRYALPSLTALACVNLIVWGYQLGGLGGPGMLWFNFFPQLISTVVVISLTAAARLLVSVAFALAMVLGYFGMHPEHFADPYAPAVLSCLVCSVLGFTAVGLVTEHYRRQAFFLRRATERQAEALEEMNGQLERRVAEQTAELRSLSHRLETARELERTRIARELHDELGQELTALRLALKFTRLRHEQGGNLRGSLSELEELLARMTTTTRNILVDLRPRVLDDLGLAAAAEWLVERTRQRLSIPVRLDLPTEELRLSDEVATAAFRILQEALTNVMRHANASRVDIALRCEPESIELVIQDDGVGMQATAPSPGLGVVGMRERALAAGGELLVESAPGSGTTLRVRLPRLKPHAHPEVA